MTGSELCQVDEHVGRRWADLAVCGSGACIDARRATPAVLETFRSRRCASRPRIEELCVKTTRCLDWKNYGIRAPSPKRSARLDEKAGRRLCRSKPELGAVGLVPDSLTSSHALRYPTGVRASHARQARIALDEYTTGRRGSTSR